MGIKSPTAYLLCIQNKQSNNYPFLKNITNIMTRGNKKKKRKNTVVPENLIYRSASLDGIEIGNPDHRTDNGSNNNTTGGDAEQEVLERRRNGGLGHIRSHH